VTQIDIAQILLILPILTIIISIFIYFIKLEIRMRKVEDIERSMNLESRIKQLETDPLLAQLRQIKVGDAINLYREAGGQKSESA
jgi:hypothetical protein